MANAYPSPPPKKISENYNMKGSQAGGSQWLLDSRAGVSLLVVNLALGLPNYESGFYMTPGPSPHPPPPRGLAKASCLSAGWQRQKDTRVQMSMYMNNPPNSSDDTDLLCHSFT